MSVVGATRPVPTEYAAALSAGREVRGFTLRQLSAWSRITAQRIRAFERGHAVPTPEEFATLWAILTSDPDRGAPDA